MNPPAQPLPYNDPRRPILTIPSRRALNLAWSLLLASTFCFAALAIAMIWENHHFDDFFYSRYPHSFGFRYSYSFQKGLFDGESDWRSWQGFITGKTEWYRRPLTGSELAAMAARTSERGRWNVFVDLVTWGMPAEGVLLIVTLLCAILIWKRDPAAFRRRAAALFAAGVALAALYLVFAGYLYQLNDLCEYIDH